MSVPADKVAAERTDADVFAELMGEAPAAPEPQVEEPAAEPVAEPAAGEPVSSSSQADPNMPDWLQALPEDQREGAKSAWDKLVESNRQLETNFSRERQARAAAEGRVAPMQRRLAQYEADPARAAAPTPPAPTGSGAAHSNSQLDSFFDSAGWKKFEQEFPEEAATQRAAHEFTARKSDERLARLEARLGAVAPVVDQMVVSREVTEQIALLEAEHQDWREINTSPEFMEWLTEYRLSQPKAVRATFMDDAQFRAMCMEADFAIPLLNQFKRDKYIADLYMQQQADPDPATAPATNTPTPAPARTAPAQHGSALRALTRSPDVRGGAAPRKVDMSSLPDAEVFDILFNGNNP